MVPRIGGFVDLNRLARSLAVFNMLKRLEEYLLNVSIIQRVIHRLAFLTPLHNPHIAQGSQLMGDG